MKLSIAAKNEIGIEKKVEPRIIFVGKSNSNKNCLEETAESLTKNTGDSTENSCVAYCVQFLTIP